MVNPHPRDVERSGEHDKDTARQAQAAEPEGHSDAITDAGAGMRPGSGSAEGSPGGSVSGEIGLGEKLAGPGEADLGGDTDMTGGSAPTGRDAGLEQPEEQPADEQSGG